MNQLMDDEFRHFYEDNDFGPSQDVEAAASSLIAAYKEKVPQQLLMYWSMYGFCSYGQGIFWIVNPLFYESLIPLWLRGTGFLERDEYSVIARNAFGRLYLWGKSSGQSLKVECAWGSIFPRDQSDQISTGRGDVLVQRFFGGQQKKNVDLEDDAGKLLFQRARRLLGGLAPDEMYGFEPALALGGQAKLENLRKVKIIPQLTILAQLRERKVMRDIVQDAKRAGLVK